MIQLIYIRRKQRIEKPTCHGNDRLNWILLHLLQTSSSDLSSQSSWSSQTQALGIHWPDLDLQAHSSGPQVLSTKNKEYRKMYLLIRLEKEKN